MAIVIGHTTIPCPRCSTLIQIDITTKFIPYLVGSRRALTVPLAPDLTNLYTHLEACPPPPRDGLPLAAASS